MPPLAPWHPNRGDGDQAALINYAYLAHAVPSTEQILVAKKDSSAVE